MTNEDYIMPKKITTNEFIAKAVNVHGKVYDYSKVVYVNSREKITIICKEHGEFKQIPTNHLKGNGCDKCRICKVKKALSKTNEDFIKEAQTVHKNTYSYELTNYTGNKNKVVITCKVHGNFEQEAKSHLNGSGCRKCSDLKVSSSLRSNTIEFIEKANKIHDNKYNYCITKYVNAKDKVSIICKKHGKFTQSPNTHLNGGGCPKCKVDKLKTTPGRWSYSEWEKAGELSSNFEGFSLYVIKCTGNGEEFIKVGKTFNSVGKRFSANKLPYKFTVKTQVYYNAYAISKLEKSIHKELKDYKYEPKRAFKGDSECFSLDALEKAVTMAET